MSLPHALLTALIERPSSGSDLASRFDRSIGYFWKASHQQIYRELARLEATGQIESLPEESGRGRKRAYRILAPGRTELERWVGQGEAAPLLRDELMVRLWAEATIGPAGLVDLVRHRRDQHRDKLALYEGFMARDYPAAPADRASALRRLVLKAGIDHERLWAEFLDEAETILTQSWPAHVRPSGRASRQPARKRASSADLTL